MEQNRRAMGEVAMLVLAILSSLVLITSLVFLSQGHGNWFTALGSMFTLLAMLISLINSRRARRKEAISAKQVASAAEPPTPTEDTFPGSR